MTHRLVQHLQYSSPRCGEWVRDNLPYEQELSMTSRAFSRKTRDPRSKLPVVQAEGPKPYREV